MDALGPEMFSIDNGAVLEVDPTELAHHLCSSQQKGSLSEDAAWKRIQGRTLRETLDAAAKSVPFVEVSNDHGQLIVKLASASSLTNGSATSSNTFVLEPDENPWVEMHRS